MSLTSDTVVVGSPVMPVRLVTPSQRLGASIHADYARTGRQANAGAFVKAMTDGEMNAMDMVSSLINHIPPATSEDLQWGMLWSDLVSSRWSR
jgi:hypothetical protein